MSEPTILGYALAARPADQPDAEWDIGQTNPTVEELRAGLDDEIADADVAEVLGDFDLRIVEVRVVGEFTF